MLICCEYCRYYRSSGSSRLCCLCEKFTVFIAVHRYKNRKEIVFNKQNCVMSTKKAKRNLKQPNLINKKQCQSSNKKLIMEQRANIKFCQGLGKSASETWQMIQLVYGSTSISRSQVYKWYKLFVEGRQSLEDEPRSGRPLTGLTNENIAKATEINKHGKMKSLRALAKELRVSVGTCYSIIKITKMSSPEKQETTVTKQGS